MNERGHLDDLETYLQAAPIIGMASHAMGGGGHPGSFVLVFEGGIGALAKLEAAAGDGPQMVRREAAAWSLAKALGWPDLVAATILRDVPAPGGASGFASIQVLWPMNHVGVPESAFPDEDNWRAAIFDALIRASDRHAGNWLAVPREPNEGQQRLKLIDHGHAFDLNRAANSPFYLMRRGQEIPGEYVDSLESLDISGLGELLDSGEFNGLRDRLEVLRNGHLDVPEH